MIVEAIIEEEEAEEKTKIISPFVVWVWKLDKITIKVSIKYTFWVSLQKCKQSPQKIVDDIIHSKTAETILENVVGNS